MELWRQSYLAHQRLPMNTKSSHQSLLESAIEAVSRVANFYHTELFLTSLLGHSRLPTFRMMFFNPTITLMVRAHHSQVRVTKERSIFRQMLQR